MFNIFCVPVLWHVSDANHPLSLCFQIKIKLNTLDRVSHCRCFGAALLVVTHTHTHTHTVTTTGTAVMSIAECKYSRRPTKHIGSTVDNNTTVAYASDQHARQNTIICSLRCHYISVRVSSELCFTV